MTVSLAFRFVCLTAALGAWFAVHAESFASSASSAGSASSGSVSTSLHGSSDSSTGGNKRADGDYRVIDMAALPERAGFARMTLQAEAPGQRLMLDLPQAIVDAQGLVRGDVVHAQRRAYGYAFARGDAHEAFYLVLDDDWVDELAARPVRL